MEYKNGVQQCKHAHHSKKFKWLETNKVTAESKTLSIAKESPKSAVTFYSIFEYAFEYDGQYPYLNIYYQTSFQSAILCSTFFNVYDWTVFILLFAVSSISGRSNQANNITSC